METIALLESANIRLQDIRLSQNIIHKYLILYEIQCEIKFSVKFKDECNIVGKPARYGNLIICHDGSQQNQNRVWTNENAIAKLTTKTHLFLCCWVLK